MATKYPSVVNSPSQDDDIILTTSAGKVGIGTTSPGTNLDVSNANYGIVVSDSSVTANKLYLSGNSSDVCVGKNLRTKSGEWSNASTASASAGMVMGSAGDISLFTREGGAAAGMGTCKAYIANGGNVGVGTASPKGLLQLKSSWVMAPAPLGSGQDDRGAIQDCIDEVYGSGGGTVVLQNGIYTINNFSGQSYGLLLKDGVHLSGVSMVGTILQPGVSGTSSSVPFEIIRLDVPANFFIVGSIQNLCINNGTGAEKSYITGINVGNSTLSGPQPFVVENVRLIHCDTGILVGSWFSEIRSCEFRGCTTGINLHYDYTNEKTNAMQVIHCILFSDGDGVYGSSKTMDTGIKIDGFCNQIVDCNIGGFTNKGIDIANADAKANYIAGNYIESSLSNVVGIYVRSKGNTIIGQYFDLSSSSSGNEIEFSSSGIQTGNTVLGNYSGNSIDAPLNNQIFGPVGIEVASPSCRLSLGGGTGDRLALWDDGAGTIDGFGNQENLLQMYGHSSANDITFGYGTSASMVRNVSFKGTGNVGIGTTNPDHKLAVSDTTTGMATQAIFGQDKTSGQSQICIGEQATTSKALSIGYDHDSHYGFMQVAGDDIGTVLVLKKGTNQLDGKVGVGLTNPGEKLEVNGNIKTSGYLDVNGPRIISGAGNPNTNSVVANPGSLYLNTNGGAGTTLYVKESGTGGSGWVAK